MNDNQFMGLLFVPLKMGQVASAFKKNKIIGKGNHFLIKATFSLLTQQKKRNSNGHKFLNGSPIQPHIILRSLKLNNRSSREIQMVITFHTDVRLKCMTYRDFRK